MPTTKINNAEYAEIHLKGKDISNKYAQLQLAMWFENVKDAEIQLTKDMLQMVDEQKAAGMPPQRIINRLTYYAEDHGFESFLNESATNLWQAMKKISQNNLYNSLPMANLYQWQMNPGAKHCEVCSRLNGQIKSIEEWREEGLPGHRQEGCYANCCCDLVKIKSHRTRDIRERNDAGINQRYDPNKPKELTKDATAEEIREYVQKSSKNFYVEKLREEFKGIKFRGIDELDKASNYTRLMNDIKVNYAEQTYITLKYVEKTIGKTALSGVEKIEIVPFEEKRRGQFDQNNLTVSMNVTVYGKGNVSSILKPTEFSDILLHELTHSLFYKHTKKLDRIVAYSKEIDRTKMLDFTNDNMEFLFKRFPELWWYYNNQRTTVPEEVHVRLVSKYYTGELMNKNYEDANKYTKEHKMLIKYARTLIEQFKKWELLDEKGTKKN